MRVKTLYLRQMAAGQNKVRKAPCWHLDFCDWAPRKGIAGTKIRWPGGAISLYL